MTTQRKGLYAAAAAALLVSSATSFGEFFGMVQVDFIGAMQLLRGVWIEQLGSLHILCAIVFGF